MRHTTNVGAVDSGLTLTSFDLEALIEHTGMPSIFFASETEAQVIVHRGSEDKPKIAVKDSGRENRGLSCVGAIS